jgi:hypothetical protein
MEGPRSRLSRAVCPLGRATPTQEACALEAPLEAQPEPEVCRICWADAEDGAQLLTPCACKGGMVRQGHAPSHVASPPINQPRPLPSQAHAHRECLVRWQRRLRVQKGTCAAQCCDVCRRPWAPGCAPPRDRLGPLSALWDQFQQAPVLVLLEAWRLVVVGIGISQAVRALGSALHALATAASGREGGAARLGAEVALAVGVVPPSQASVRLVGAPRCCGPHTLCRCSPVFFPAGVLPAAHTCRRLPWLAAWAPSLPARLIPPPPPPTPPHPTHTHTPAAAAAAGVLGAGQCPGPGAGLRGSGCGQRRPAGTPGDGRFARCAGTTGARAPWRALRCVGGRWTGIPGPECPAYASGTAWRQPHPPPLMCPPQGCFAWAPRPGARSTWLGARPRRACRSLRACCVSPPPAGPSGAGRPGHELRATPQSLATHCPLYLTLPARLSCTLATAGSTQCCMLIFLLLRCRARFLRSAVPSRMRLDCCRS